MSSEQVKDYDAKCDALQNATAKAERLVKTVVEAAKKLQQDWRRTTISDIPQSNSISEGAREGKPMLSINGMAWPSAVDLASALAAYHSARQAAHQLYGNLLAAGLTVLPPEKQINGGRGPWR